MLGENDKMGVGEVGKGGRKERRDRSGDGRKKRKEGQKGRQKGRETEALIPKSFHPAPFQRWRVGQRVGPAGS